MPSERFKLPWLWHAPLGTAGFLFGLREAWRDSWDLAVLLLAGGAGAVLVSRWLRQGRADANGISVPSWGALSWSEVASARLYWRGAALELRDGRIRVLPKDLLRISDVQASIRAAAQTLPALTALLTDERAND
jgi:hypothetical protein